MTKYWLLCVDYWLVMNNELQFFCVHTKGQKIMRSSSNQSWCFCCCKIYCYCLMQYGISEEVPLISFAKLMKAIKIVWISLSWMEGRVQISHSTDISGCCFLGWAYLSLPSISPNADIIGFQCSTINQGEVLDKRSANRKHFSW